MVDLVYYLTTFFFDIALLYFYTNLGSLIICYIFSGDTFLPLGISLSYLLFSVSFLTVPKLFCVEDIEIFVILSAILLLIKSPVA